MISHVMGTEIVIVLVFAYVTTYTMVVRHVILAETIDTITLLVHVWF